MNNTIISQMLNKYCINNTNDEINALKEIIQEIVLSGLSRGNFFSEAAFYGGTALRIFYKLDRFSEDLDFSLLQPNSNFNLTKYFSYVERELQAYGINMAISSKEKNIDTNIESAFIKGDTLKLILLFFPNEVDHIYDRLFKQIKIKLEIDVVPPEGATYDVKYKMLPSPHIIKTYDRESLFAGKVHALLCRKWDKRGIKGRDLYDYLFFINNNTKINMVLLKNKLIESNYISLNDKFDKDKLKIMLINKFNEIDYLKAKEDVIPFINDIDTLSLWNKDFFISTIDNI